MVHKYMRKTTQQSWDVEQMEAAIRAVREGAAINAAAREHAVPVATLFRRVKKQGVGAKKGLGRFRPIFSVEQENILVGYLLEMEQRFFGLTRSDLRHLAFQYAERNQIAHTFNKIEQKAGKDWINAFLRRNTKLSLRLPEKTSAARATAFNRVNLDKFFDLLEDLYEKHHYTTDRIYNCDETGITTVPNRPSKIISQKGKKQVGVLSSAERGTLVTAEICFNAAGNYIPPALIFPRARMNPMFEIGTPPNTKIFTHPSGWMQSDIFVEWFKHFLKYSKPTAEERVLLILDGHATHINNLEVLLLAKENHVDILVLPPHTTHRLQPLDVAFMFPLSAYYEQAVRVWLREHPGKVVTIYEVGTLFGEAYTKAATLQNAISGFRKTGIYPLQRIFPEDCFAAAETTNRLPPNENQVQTPSVATALPPTQLPETLLDAKLSNLIPSAGESSTPTLKTTKETHSLVVSPYDIMPIPHVVETPGDSGQKLHRRKGRRGKTTVATSTPFIEDLKEKKTLEKMKQTRSKKKAKKVKRTLFDSDSESAASLKLNDSDSEWNESFSSLEEDWKDKMNGRDSEQNIITPDMVSEGTWVLVKYNGEHFPGLIVKKTKNRVSVKCMEKTQKFFRWPIKEDLLIYSYEDLHLIINEPKKLKRGFFHVPELSQFVST